MTDIKQLKKDRFTYLEFLYKTVGASTFPAVKMIDLGNELNFDYSYTRNIADYLISEGLIKPYSMGGAICITHQGIIEVEEALSNPEKPTQHFLPVNQYNITVQNMTNSAIQQGNSNSTQNASLSYNDIADIKDFTKELIKSIGNLKLNQEQENELRSEIQTIEIQTNSPKPKKAILNVALNSIKEILEGITVELAKPYAQSLLTQLGLLLQA